MQPDSKSIGAGLYLKLVQLNAFQYYLNDPDSQIIYPGEQALFPLNFTMKNWVKCITFSAKSIMNIQKVSVIRELFGIFYNF